MEAGADAVAMPPAPSGCESAPKCDPAAAEGQHTDIAAEISFGAGSRSAPVGTPGTASIAKVISRNWPNFDRYPTSVPIHTCALGHRFERLAMTYRATAMRLSSETARWQLDRVAGGDADPVAVQTLIENAEIVMAAENDASLSDLMSSSPRTARPDPSE